ncbi:histidine phosphatase family protein [Deinococcus arcticus]|uniref:histidine phosphatase family protein n=1 Tax=Deinococcus arcticus TaxID=2136176 RepID=UPI001304A032|nr:histidine phosphatase family protein [Deinococcus arcticus]
MSFHLPTLRFPGGESGHQAQARIQAALQDARDPAGVSVVVTHGNLLTLGLNLRFADWAALRNPDVWLWVPGTRPRRLDPEPLP